MYYFIVIMKIIVAYDDKNGIGKAGGIPWFLKNELKYFANVTKHTNNPLLQNVVIMGRKTWESLPRKPLPGRINVVLTCSGTIYEDAYSYSSLEIALNELKNMDNVNKDNIYIIGGAQLYKEALESDECEKLYATEVYGNYNADTFFPKIPVSYELTDVSQFYKENDIHYRHLVYTNRNYYGPNFNESYIWKNKEELMYLETLEELVSTGIENVDRTGVGTLSVFGKSFKYDLSKTFPVLTTRRQFLRGVFEELMFYLSGKTDNKILQEKGIHIWDGNTSREFLDN
jgi:dihydrofolate reductase/thymidylate synthase